MQSFSHWEINFPCSRPHPLTRYESAEADSRDVIQIDSCGRSLANRQGASHLYRLYRKSRSRGEGPTLWRQHLYLHAYAECRRKPVIIGFWQESHLVASLSCRGTLSWLIGTTLSSSAAKVARQLYSAVPSETGSSRERNQLLSPSLLPRDRRHEIRV